MRIPHYLREKVCGDCDRPESDRLPLTLLEIHLWGDPTDEWALDWFCPDCEAERRADSHSTLEYPMGRATR